MDVINRHTTHNIVAISPEKKTSSSIIKRMTHGFIFFSNHSLTGIYRVMLSGNKMSHIKGGTDFIPQLPSHHAKGLQPD